MGDEDDEDDAGASSDVSETEMEDDDMVEDVGPDEIGETSMAPMVSVPSDETSMPVTSNDQVSNSEVPCLTAASSSARAPDTAHEPSGASIPASKDQRKKELEGKIAELQRRLGSLSNKTL